jgi:hypothetical protein
MWGNFWLENSGFELNFEKIYILQPFKNYFTKLHRDILLPSQLFWPHDLSLRLGK